MNKWDHTTDLLVIGSGGGGMTSALVGKYAGLDVIVLEKTEFFGGSTARSGGGVWVPNNHFLAQEGVIDSFEQAQVYMNHTVGSRVPQAKQETFLENAPEMIEWMQDHTYVKFQRMSGYSDYYPERPGGLAAGRSLEPISFNGNRIGDDLSALRPPLVAIPWGLSFTSSDYQKLGMLTSTWAGKFTAVKSGIEALLNQTSGIRQLTMGQALIARLRFSLKAAGIPLWLNTSFSDLIIDEGRVIGVKALKNGQELSIRVRVAVILAAGGFPHNLEMRLEYGPHPITTNWTVASPGNTGDTIKAGIQHGAAIDLMDDAWWGPISRPPGEAPFFHVGERGYPGGLMVNGHGERFVNESASYVDVVHVMYENHSADNPHIPSYFIFDQRYRRKYLFGKIFPGQPLPQKYLDLGYIKKANSIMELAQQLGMNPAILESTINKFNKYAASGNDQDFGRGKSAYDNYYGDPSISPNPNLAPLKEAPFYAVAFWPGDLGTKGGLLTDEFARVLREDGSIIRGLFAIGNNAASMMGNTYPGPGATIAPAMTFGYIAARAAAGGKLPVKNRYWPEMIEDTKPEKFRRTTVTTIIAVLFFSLLFWLSKKR